MNWLVNLLGGGLVESVRKGIGMFTGDRAARETGYHDESMESRRQFSTEFQVMNRTWFDSLIDGINRMPRPVIVAMVVYYFVLSVRDPIDFQRVNISLDTVPENMWYLAGIIVSFYFVAREMQKSREKKMAMTKAQFNEHMRQIKELDAMENPTFTENMADETKPLSDAAIAEWNRRRS